MKAKRKYEKPAMQVYELPQSPGILAVSGKGGLEDYNRQTNSLDW